jgi:raffinose synthase
MGLYHAAGRAVSGGPVYVSDKPDGHDFAVLKKLVLSDGTILRARSYGRPTRDCLFRDPLREPVLLKIFNTNEDAGIVGIFNTQYHEGDSPAPLTGTVSPADVAGLTGETFILFAHTTQASVRGGRTMRVEVSLSDLSFELFTIVPIRDGYAPLGLIDKFNSAGAVERKGPQRDGYAFTLRDGGCCAVWCATCPEEIDVDNVSHPFNWDADTQLARLDIVAPGRHQVCIPSR